MHLATMSERDPKFNALRSDGPDSPLCHFRNLCNRRLEAGMLAQVSDERSGPGLTLRSLFRFLGHNNTPVGIG